MTERKTEMDYIIRKITQDEIEAENQSSSEVEDETPDEDSGMTMGM